MLRAGCHPTFGSGSGLGLSNVAVSIVRAPRLGDRSAIPSAKGLRSRCTCTHGRCWRCSREHRDTPSSRRARRRYRPPNPAAAKLLARQQRPRHYLLGHHYAASNRAGLGYVVSPCPRLRPRRARSRGGWDTPLGGVRVSETATIVKLAIFVYYLQPDCAPRPLQIPSGGISTQECPKSLQPGRLGVRCWRPVLAAGHPAAACCRGAAIQGLIRPGCASTLQTPTRAQWEQTRRRKR